MALDVVVAGVAAEQVVVLIAVDAVVPAAAGDGVATGVPAEAVPAAVPQDAVVVLAALDGVATALAPEGIVAGAALLMIGTPPVPATATPPGPNGRITFHREDDNGFAQVWTANPDLTAAQQVTSGPAYSGFPAWAPDASRIAFERRPQRLDAQFRAGTRVVSHGDTLVLETNRGPTAVGEACSALIAVGAVIRSVTVRESDLAEVFRRLTGAELGS